MLLHRANPPDLRESQRRKAEAPRDWRHSVRRGNVLQRKSKE